MAMIKKTGEQMMKSITPKMISDFRAAAKRKVNMRDPDVLTPTDAMWAKAARVGRPRALHPKKLIAIRVDHDIYAATKKFPGYSARINDMMRGMFTAAGLL